jgi:hypothetical protein
VEQNDTQLETVVSFRARGQRDAHSGQHENSQNKCEQFFEHFNVPPHIVFGTPDLPTKKEHK